MNLSLSSKIMNQTPFIGQYQGLYHSIMAMNQQQQVINMAQSQSEAMMMNNQPLMMTAPSFSVNHNLVNPNNYGHNLNGKQMEPIKRMHNSGILIGPGGNRGLYNNVQPQLHGTGSGRSSGLNKSQNRKFYPKKYGNRYVPYAPRNTSSFIIRAKKSGGIADLVSPCPVTPSVLPTPMFSPSGEVLGDMVKEEWGVDGYGSMEGLIRLRSDGGHGLERFDEDEGGSCESEVEDHVEVERRLDHDLSRFEMVCPKYGDGFECNNVLENRVDDQDCHIAQIEEDSVTMKERLFMMERQVGDLRRRLESLERHHMVVVEDGNGEVVENESESDRETGRSGSSTSGDTKENHLAAKELCVQDVAMDEAAGNEINNA